MGEINSSISLLSGDFWSCLRTIMCCKGRSQLLKLISLNIIKIGIVIIELLMIKPFNPFRNNEKQGLAKNKSEYELYEDDLNNYKSRSKSNLQQWNMLSNRLSPSSPSSKLKLQSQIQHTEPSQVAKNGLESKKDRFEGKSTQKSRISENKNKTETVPMQSFSKMYHKLGQKIKQQFDSAEDSHKPAQQLQKQMKDMREMLQQLNNIVTTKLNKYELTYLQPKGMQVTNQPQKEQQIIKAKIEINNKILQSLQKQKNQVICRDQQLEQKDYLIQLEELVCSVVEDIKVRRKEKHQEGVIVEKKDNRLIQLRELEEDDQYKMVKILKHNILFFFKKYHQNVAKLGQLDAKLGQLADKDRKILQKYSQAAKIAEQRNMLVKANPVYVENKKIHDQLVVKVDLMKKKIEVTKRSKQMQSEKLSKDIESMKKESVIFDSRIQDLTANVSDFTKNTNQTIQKYQVSSKLLNKISYKFAQALLKDSSNTNYTGSSVMESEHEPRGNVTARPKLKLNKNKSITNSVQVSALSSGRYSTLENPTYGNTNPKDEKINDKNVETIEFVENKSREFRIKPALNISLKKRNLENKSRLNETNDVKDEVLEKDGKDQINYKPRRFQKIISQRKDIGV